MCKGLETIRSNVDRLILRYERRPSLDYDDRTSKRLDLLQQVKETLEQDNG